MKASPIGEVILPIPLDKVFHYRIPAKLVSSLVIGQRVKIPFGKRKEIGYLVGLRKKSEIKKLKKIFDSYAPELFLTNELLTLSRWLADYYFCSWGEAVTSILPLRLRKRKLFTYPKRSLPNITSLPVTLTKSQQRVVETIKKSIESGERQTFLLHGVSASGKTEVYFQAIESCLKKNREAIFLLPEIALTPQFIERIRERFGQAGLWHSRLSQGEKYANFLAAHRSEIKIMLGARSAIFTPFKNLGLIIIDEEHEFTYKQDKKPFYHACEVALKRAELNNAVVILGSATPSLESYNSGLNNEFKLLELPERVPVRPDLVEAKEGVLPEISIVDMREEIRRGNRGVFSEELKNALTDCLNRKEQAILFLNRRGYSTFLLCRRCGYIAKCPRCQLSLVYHRGKNIFCCHFCSYHEVVPFSCPWCRSTYLSFSGTGTEKVETEIQILFPNARIRRMDLDTTRRKNVYEEIYYAFKNEKIDFLIGTQMIAKGFDFPKVSVVGIINADIALHLPDFRASERTFQLVSQVAGRAGRAEIPGKVILQTYCPEHYVFKTVAEHAYDQFYSQEIKLRRELGYPPFTHLVRILLRSKKEDRLRTLAEKMVEDINFQIRLLKLEDVKVSGPAPAAYPRIGGKHRWQIVLKGNIKDLTAILAPFRGQQFSQTIQVSIDVDSLDLL